MKPIENWIHMPPLTFIAFASSALRKSVPAQATLEAARLPMPVPLLLQLLRPLHNEDDVDSLSAHLHCARARGCF